MTDPDGQGWIAQVDVESGERYDLTGKECHDYHPAWSPDGNRIAFDTNHENSGIAVIDADGSGRRQLTEGTTDFDPAWSPDGEEIYFFRTG